MKTQTILIAVAVAVALYFVFKSPTFTGALSPTVNAAGQAINPLTGLAYAGPATSATTTASLGLAASLSASLAKLFGGSTNAATGASAAVGPQLPANAIIGSYESAASSTSESGVAAGGPDVTGYETSGATDQEILSYESGTYDYSDPTSDTAPDYSALVDTSGDVIS